MWNKRIVILIIDLASVYARFISPKVPTTLVMLEASKRENQKWPPRLQARFTLQCQCVKMSVLI